MKRFFDFIPLRRFYASLGAVAVLFVLAYMYPALYGVARGTLILTLFVTLADYIVLFARPRPLTAERRHAARFSNGDPNPVTLELCNRLSLPLRATVYDEVPDIFQFRHSVGRVELSGGESRQLRYVLTPGQRGMFRFGRINILLQSVLGFIGRFQRQEAGGIIHVYPSFQKLKAYDLNALTLSGPGGHLKRVRRVGTTMEFDQIRAYVPGDDFRFINWAATARKHQVMVNQYQDEQAQSVYMIINNSRVMHMPFDGLSLLDHSINSALVTSHIVLQRKDRPGLLSFSAGPPRFLAASAHNRQMTRILDHLYRLETDRREADYERLYVYIQKHIPQRSLIILYTNFESRVALERVLPVLREINRKHVLMLIYFKNEQVEKLREGKAPDLTAVHTQVMAEQYLYEKEAIRHILKHHGIMALFVTPSGLTIEVLNSYLAIKARHII
ncbi:MAG TPA: DUF58 domain-containing protein [Caldithrix abyssi]|uniref:DUF58 domain-containing protein n=1 Tax=Caldithrix abyssi TaxID=187145 RepID=A0A7V5RQF9_CALAY|nr:DUF58 domain-containing protein [Caldithrix abyssi]